MNFFVMGLPIAQPRAIPRFAKTGEYVGKYDPPKAKSWKGSVAWQVGEQMRLKGHKPISNAVMMSMEFILPRPKSHFGKKGLLPRAPVYHTKKPDVDNLVKGVKDAIKGVCYNDDAQVIGYREPTYKRYAREGEQLGVVITLSEVA